MNKVIVYNALLLPYTQTFIREQIRACRRWKPILVGERVAPDRLSLDGLDCHLLRAEHENLIQLSEYLLYRCSGYVPRRYADILQGIRAKLVHCHFGTNAVDIWPLVNRLRLPMLVTLHGYDITRHRRWWERGHGGLHRCCYPRKMLALAKEPRVHFIGVSDAIRNRAVAYGIPGDKITVCHIGVDTQRFKPAPSPIDERPYRVLFVGRLVEKKGLTYLIQAFSEVTAAIPQAELIVVGDGPLRVRLETQAMNTGARITFLGALNSDQVKKQMDEARIFCLPSITASNGDAEGLPISILEAQACGLPVVTTASGGAREGIICGKSGFSCDEKDISSLKKALMRLLSCEEEMLQQSINARWNAVKNHNIIKNTERLEKLYDAMIC